MEVADVVVVVVNSEEDEVEDIMFVGTTTIGGISGGEGMDDESEEEFEFEFVVVNFIFSINPLNPFDKLLALLTVSVVVNATPAVVLAGSFLTTGATPRTTDCIGF